MSVNNEARMVTFIDIHSSMTKVVKPIQGKWLPPEVELLEIYHKIYSPQFYGDRTELLKLENSCWEAHGVTGSGNFASDESSDSESELVEGGRNDRKNNTNKNTKVQYPYNATLLSWMKTRKDCVLIGPTATDVSTRNNYRVQIITSSPIKSVVENIKLTIKRLLSIEVSSYIGSFDTVPGEYRLSKIILKTSSGYLAEVYNSASFELIPFNIVNGIQTATVPVILRYIMLDIWAIKSLGSTGRISEHCVSDIVRRYYNIMSSIRDGITNESTDMLGVYCDDVVAKKKLALSNQFMPYYPARYKSINGSYRII